jgi:hypothetical protein
LLSRQCLRRYPRNVGSKSGKVAKDAAMLVKFRQCLGRVSKNDLKLLMHMAQKMAR